ncbi:MAG: DnaJ domain-containing protein [Candidatus Omnitrophica bacterium]|nr:DnaJ domain-containing protein [Candidatus Omnitrophota bacterium]
MHYYRNSGISKTICLLLSAFLVIGDISWAAVSDHTGPGQTTLAPELRLKPFCQATGLDFNTMFCAYCAACALRDILKARPVRGGDIARLNARFPADRLEILVDPGCVYDSQKKYYYAVFNFKETGLKVMAIFPENYDDLDDRQLAALGIRNPEDKDFFLYHEPRGVWFEKQGGPQPVVRQEQRSIPRGQIKTALTDTKTIDTAAMPGAVSDVSTARRMVTPAILSVLGLLIYVTDLFAQPAHYADNRINAAIGLFANADIYVAGGIIALCMLVALHLIAKLFPEHKNGTKERESDWTRARRKFKGVHPELYLFRSREPYRRARRITGYAALGEKDHFATLGISPVAARDYSEKFKKKVAKAANDLSHLCHPDLIPPEISPKKREELIKQFKRIQDAYEILMDRKKYEQYLDTEIVLEYAEEPAAGNKRPFALRHPVSLYYARGLLAQHNDLKIWEVVGFGNGVAIVLNDSEKTAVSVGSVVEFEEIMSALIKDSFADPRSVTQLGLKRVKVSLRGGTEQVAMKFNDPEDIEYGLHRLRLLDEPPPKPVLSGKPAPNRTALPFFMIGLVVITAFPGLIKWIDGRWQILTGFVKSLGSKIRITSVMKKTDETVTADVTSRETAEGMPVSAVPALVLSGKSPDLVSSLPELAFKKNSAAASGKPRVQKTFAQDVKDRTMAIHEATLEITPAVPKKTILCHIIPDSLLPIGQLNMLRDLERDMAKPRGGYIERVVRLKGDVSRDLIQRIQETMADYKNDHAKDDGGFDYEFDVACPDREAVAQVQEKLGIRALAFGWQEQACDIVQLEGIILALRALRSDDANTLKAVYSFLTGETADNDMTDVRELARRLVFKLPVAKVDIDSIPALNRLIRENIENAA